MTTALVTPQSWHIELRKARRGRRMSQREMENLTGIRQSHLSRIENGRADPKLSQAVQMARAVELEFVLVPRRALAAAARLLQDFGGAGERGRRLTAVELIVRDIKDREDREDREYA